MPISTVSYANNNPSNSDYLPIIIRFPIFPTMFRQKTKHIKMNEKELISSLICLTATINVIVINENK